MTHNHNVLTNEATLQELEQARKDWMQEAKESGFLTLCYLLATKMGRLSTERIEGTRRNSTVMYSFVLPNTVEVTVFSSGGNWLPDQKEYEKNDTVLVGKGRWPKYEELYCNMTLSNNDNKQDCLHEFFVPGKWQDQINNLYDLVHKVVSKENDTPDKKRKQELLEQLLIGKEV